MKSISYLFKDGRPKIVTMSYDDGTIHDRRLVEIFNQFSVRGSFHLNSGKLDTEGYIKSDEVKNLYQGHEISTHTVNHPMPNLIPIARMNDEIYEDRKCLEALSGYIVRGMSYPYGVFSEEVVCALPLQGIEYCRTTLSTGKFSLPDNLLLWNPTCHHKDVLGMAKTFAEGADHLPLLYVWGHSYEFDRNNNWDLIEDFCKYISKHDNIWYATNIEIVDYIKSLKNLKFSADGSMVYNPSNLSVWLKADGKTYRIERGQTVNIL